MEELKNNEQKEVRTPPVDFIIHEAALARMERQAKRLFILCIVMFTAFVGSNVCWLIYESQFDDIALTQTATADGDSDIVLNGVGSGEVTYYGSESDANSQDKTP